MQYLQILISHIFRMQHCLHFFFDDSFASTHVAQTLMAGEFPVMTSRLEATPKEETCNCEGYIVASNNFTSLIHLFNRKQFKPHRRLAVFYDGKADFLTGPFLLSAGQHAVDLYVIQNFLNNSGGPIEVIDVYRRKTLNLWNDLGKLEVDERDFASKTWRPDFSVGKNLKFKAAAFNCSPYVLIDEGNRVYGGVQHKIIQEIAKDWPFEYRVHQYSFDKDLYLEVTNDVLNGTSDVAMCDHWMVFSMLRQCDISYPYTQACITFLVPKPLKMPDLTFVFQPITAMLWGIIFIGVFLAASALYASTKWRCTQNIAEHTDFVTCVLNILRLLTLDTLESFPPSNKYVQRMIITSWCIICLVLTTGYSAGFSSLLTYPRFYRRINTLQDMADAHIHWGEASLVTRNYLASNPNAHDLLIAKLFRYETSIEVKLERIKRNDYATMVTVLPQRFLSSTGFLDNYAKTHLKVLSDCFGIYYFVFPLPKNSPYKQLLQEKIMRFAEHGFISFWYSEVLTTNNLRYMENFYTSYAEPIPTVHIALSVGKLQGALYLLVAGLTMAVVVFVVEIVCFRLRNK